MIEYGAKSYEKSARGNFVGQQVRRLGGFPYIVLR